MSELNLQQIINARNSLGPDPLEVLCQQFGSEVHADGRWWIVLPSELEALFLGDNHIFNHVPEWINFLPWIEDGYAMPRWPSETDQDERGEP